MIAAMAVSLLAVFHVPASRVAEVYRIAWSSLASEVLIMTGTAMPDVTPEWIEFVSGNFIEPAIGDGYTNVPLVTPAQFWPFTGLTSLSLNKSTQQGSAILDSRLMALIADNQQGEPIAAFGYSQSSFLVSVEKQLLLQEAAQGTDLPSISFVMLSNPSRPNGGLFARFYNLGLITWTPTVATVTESPFTTYDISRQYDLFSDFPAYPLNLLALVNAGFGLFNHSYEPVSLDPDSPNFDPDTMIAQYGDTTYYTIPSQLPLLRPLRVIGLSGLADFMEPVLKVLVELGYDRDTPYGQFTPFRLFPRIDLPKLGADLAAALQQSLATLRPAAPAVGSVPVSPPTSLSGSQEPESVRNPLSKTVTVPGARPPIPTSEPNPRPASRPEANSAAPPTPRTRSAGSVVATLESQESTGQRSYPPATAANPVLPRPKPHRVGARPRVAGKAYGQNASAHTAAGLLS